jgi:hypothetical protein
VSDVEDDVVKLAHDARVALLRLSLELSCDARLAPDYYLKSSLAAGAAATMTAAMIHQREVAGPAKRSDDPKAESTSKGASNGKAPRTNVASDYPLSNSPPSGWSGPKLIL